jgi:hypothetical protein
MLVAIAAAVLGLSTAMPAGDVAIAQGRSSGQPSITVTAVIAAEPTAETLLRIRISPADAVPRQSFLRIHGLPRTVSLSEGYSIAPGAWAIPLAALSRLRLSAPAGSEGRSEVTILLVSSDGIVLSEAKTTLLIAPAQQPQPGQAQASTVLRGLPAPMGPQLSAEDREQAMKYLERGNQLVASKDFSAAEHFYKRAAEIGLPEAALALARRFDPDELARSGAVGVQPDREAARKWYEKARELGSPEADAFLRSGR